ncbi:MAG: hypothetical protein ROW39_09680 [Anaerolineaceae bacterium]|jgi:hypothetical protein
MEYAIAPKLTELKMRIDVLIKEGKLNGAHAERVVRQWGKLIKDSKNAKDPLNLEPKIAKLTVTVAQFEITPALQMKKEKMTRDVSLWMSTISLGVWFFLIITNYVTMRNNTPVGWFADMRYLGFALAGVTINILLDFRNRIRRGDWDQKYTGIYISRIVQVTVYAALIYWFVSSLPVDQRNTIPFAPAALLIGLFIHLVEEALVGVGERFAEMISALFSTQFLGSRQKDAYTQEMKKRLDALRSKYTETDISSFSEEKKQVIKHLFEDALVFIHSSEPDNAESKIQEIEIVLKALSS